MVLELPLVKWLIAIIGEVLIAIGAFCDLVAAIGMLRFPNFYLRLHALTVGSIGGAFVPLIGASLLALVADFLGIHRFFLAGAGIVTAVLILILAPTGSHIIARAAHRSRVEVYPKVVDHLAEDREMKRGGET